MASSHVDVGTFLILEGAVVGARVLARTHRGRRIYPATIPLVIRPRVLLGNRLTPALAVLATAFLASGAVLLVMRG
jgi:hypothetical protein